MANAQLKVVVEDDGYVVEVPASIMTEGGSFFETMDRDMDRGWQMGRQWVDVLDTTQRCQVAAGRLADAINTENRTLLQLMAGYILTRMPGVHEIHVDSGGDLMETEFLFETA